ncbi:DUF6508 domain-containing protein [Pseudomonas silvicola]|nr:DUF6508 domain-containing protein [Pseudomonas silvicola]
MVHLPPPSLESIEELLQSRPSEKAHSLLDPSGIGFFIRAAHESGFVVPFDWMTEYPAGPPSHPHDLASLSLEQLHQLLIAHIRNDRFSEGHLTKMYRSGDLDRLLDSLQARALGTG